MWCSFSFYTHVKIIMSKDSHTVSSNRSQRMIHSIHFHWAQCCFTLTEHTFYIFHVDPDQSAETDWLFATNVNRLKQNTRVGKKGWLGGKCLAEGKKLLVIWWYVKETGQLPTGLQLSTCLVPAHQCTEPIQACLG